VTDWITQGLDAWMAQRMAYLWAAYYDPFYAYIALGIFIILLATMAAWYFDVLRPLAGAVFFGVVAFLTGMRKGQHVERDRQKALKREEPEPDDDYGGR
jgi:c-di-AMP phosphodiesterase-like protein